MTGLWTDLYELRMAASYLQRGMAGPATFSLFARRLPPQRGFLVCAGLADALAFLERFGFDDGEAAYLRQTARLGEPAVAALRRMTFTGDVWAVPEGRAVFADEPLLEVTAPIAEAQLVETALLNIITFHTTVASKAARCRLAAGGAQLIDFAFRRTQGPQAAFAVARSAAMAGFAATSNTAAARRYGLQAAGTMAHSFIEAFPDEHAAFRAFAEDFPGVTTFLVDTYDTIAGVRRAIDVVAELGLRGPVGIRLDSGDLGKLAVAARGLLDDAGLTHAQIVASGGLDERDIAALVAARAPIDAYGVGTKMGVSADAPSLDSAYKLVSYAGRPVMKLSAGKATLPGAKQVFRALDAAEGDLLGLREETAPSGRHPVLRQVMRGGKRLAAPDPDDAPDDLAAARARFDADLDWLPAAARRLDQPAPVMVSLTGRLTGLRERLAADIAGRASSAPRPPT